MGTAKMEEMPALTSSSGDIRHPTFGFGSNSVRQLRGRVVDDTLQGFPARILGQALAFGGPNWSWPVDSGSGNGTATLIPLSGHIVLGTMAFLTDAQLDSLDVFEGVPTVYDRRTFKAQVMYQGVWRETMAVAYVKQSALEWIPPSEAYCCAVLRNLRSSYPDLRKLVLRDVTGKVQGEWHHPGHAQLGLDAFLFEVGVRKKTPWTLPRAIQAQREKLRGACPCGTTAALARALESNTVPFDEEELDIVRRLLTDGGDSDDDAVAEQACESDQS